MNPFTSTKFKELCIAVKFLKGFYFQYQTETLPYGDFIQSFCVKNKVPYNIFKNIFNRCRDYVKMFLTKSLWLPDNVKFKTN